MYRVRAEGRRKRERASMHTESVCAAADTDSIVTSQSSAAFGATGVYHPARLADPRTLTEAAHDHAAPSPSLVEMDNLCTWTSGVLRDSRASKYRPCTVRVTGTSSEKLEIEVKGGPSSWKICCPRVMRALGYGSEHSEPAQGRVIRG